MINYQASLELLALGDIEVAADFSYMVSLTNTHIGANLHSISGT